MLHFCIIQYQAEEGQNAVNDHTHSFLYKLSYLFYFVWM